MRPWKETLLHTDALTIAPQAAPALALSACARLMRPVVRLALSLGLRHGELRQLLGGLVVEEGERTWRAAGVVPNVSQLSVTTGLNRKAIASRRRMALRPAPDLEMSAAARTLTQWERLLHSAPELASLPVAGDGTQVSFEAVAREASRGDLHHRAILDELVRLGLVEERDGCALLKSRSFVPQKDLRAMLAIFSDNAHDHLAAGVHNVLREGAPLLERSIYATGIAPSDCGAIEDVVRQRWAELHQELADTMTQAVDRAGPAGTARIRIGVYAYVAPLEEEVEQEHDARKTTAE